MPKQDNDKEINFSGNRKNSNEVIVVRGKDKSIKTTDHPSTVNYPMIVYKLSKRFQEEIIMINPKLSVFKRILPFIQKELSKDFAVELTDRKKFIGYLPGKEVDVGAKEGMSIQAGDAITKAMNKNSTIETFVPSEVFGTSFEAVAIPKRIISLS